MITTALILAPLAAAVYFTGPAAKSDLRVKKRGAEGDWIPENTWVYLENPIQNPYSISGDADQISIERPLGPVQEPMMKQTDPIAALKILAHHEAEKDRKIINLWPEFVKPYREIITRGVDQPITQVNILQPGSLVDRSIKMGNRFWDRPVPRSTGIDRYYKRSNGTVPYYLVP